MEEFKLSDNIDSNKVFIVKRSELERFDPEMALYSKKVFNFNFETKNLGKVLLKKPQYGANESGTERLTDEQPRYIRITDIDENGLLINNLGVTANTIESKYFLKNNDILIARSGNTVGKAYIHKSKNINYECFFAGYMIRFIVDENIILPEYVFTYTQLNIYKEWTKAIQRTAGQPNINAEEYKSLPIPIPPLEIQSNIVEIINNAYIQKQQKETEAKALLDSIDDYLLGELGITLPKEEERNLLLAAEPTVNYGNSGGFELDKENLLVKKGRLFLTAFREITGNRIAPLFYSLKFSHFVSGKYPTQLLKSIVVSLKSGIGAGKQDQLFDGSGYIQIRPTNIGEFGELLFTKNVYLPNDSQIDFLEVDDVLFNNTNSQELVGKTAIVKTSDKLFYSNHITVIKTNPQLLNPDYLSQILNCYQRHKEFYSI
jgi:type I restriction enzyme S subunit